MAKSNISDLYVSDLENRKKSPYDNDVITFTRQGVSTKIDLACLDHLFADVKQPKVECGTRLTVIDKLKQCIKSYFELDRVSYARQLFIYLRSFINNADKQQLAVFSKESWTSYFGAKGYMWRLVECAERQYAHYYMYDDKQILGVAEKSAANRKRVIKNLFSQVGLDVFEWDKGSKDFSVTGKNKKALENYSKVEHDIVLRRLHDKFFLLAPILIAEQEAGRFSDDSKGIAYSLAQAALSSKKQTLDVELLFLEGMTLNQAFNFSMEIGYHLFCHYTAFNDSVVTSVRRPIEFIKEKSEGKVSKYAIIKGFKGRAAKEVTGVIGESELEEVSARVDKRTGAAFLNMLLKLSSTFNPDEHGLLLYQLDNEGLPIELKTDFKNDNVPRKLELFADKRVGLAERLAESINSLCEHSYVEQVKRVVDDEGVRRISKSKEYYQPTSNQHTSLMLRLSVAFMQCFTAQSLRHAQLPLFYSAPDENGKITVTCTSALISSESEDAQNTVITFYLDEVFLPVVQKIEDWATARNPLFRKRKKGNQYTSKSSIDDSKYNIEPTKGASYLFPQGRSGETSFFNSYPVTAPFLSRIGLTPSHFFCTLNSTRFRKTVADNEYRHGSELTAMTVLQNSKKVFEEHYANGHQGLNNEIIAQALDVIELVIKGVELEEAKQKVRDTWKVEVLSFDEYKKRGKPSNPNGTCCDGKPEFEGQEDKLAQAAAKKMGVIDDSSKLHCYQFDKCHECLNAKLVDEPNQVYKLLSFIESLIDTADLHPENEELEKRIEAFEEIVSQNISENVLKEAEALLEANGRYFLYA
ncbi:hypothetical protein [Vibrio parahaemolyticus]|uniref:hypothetical protein n=1 Tax=Vibrio parahaemolyticus TaxID=670 RepID=UPI00112043BD|nr:hypothetical protein [Vibrio parahaemolyticus]TNZ93103.1 hypothetical protein CGK37_11010 [Vibrio parahaemolyticus]TOA14079.1 hypothetical protein CGK34_10355 [Vibrio parahaemolyticus]HCE2406277.1 hypothetical protein [Vibrio parahaemolyticus]HCG6477510.1 hypothetical protein [Vibrio parahaemolyticus]